MDATTMVGLVVSAGTVLTGAVAATWKSHGAILYRAAAAMWHRHWKELDDCKKDRIAIFGRLESLHEKHNALSEEVGELRGRVGNIEKS